jgi:hypothetical protein
MMTSFAAVRNCLSGSLSKDLCLATSMISLALDGLHSSSACNTNIYSALSQSSVSKVISESSYLLRTAIQGTIPVCLYRLPKLQVLHLSGNGLMDTLNGLTSNDSFGVNCGLSESLQDLSLSHNAFRGTIPNCIQDRNWKNLDLSFNFFSGKLSAELDLDIRSSIDNTTANPSSSMKLSVNRLSGFVPDSILHLSSISILRGNIFACSANPLSSQRDLPQHDENYQSYNCGSNSVDVAMIVFVLITTCTLGIGGCWFIGRRQTVDENATTVSTSAQTGNENQGRSTGLRKQVELSIVERVVALGPILHDWTLPQPTLIRDDRIQRFLQFDRDVLRLVLLLTVIILFIFMTTYISFSTTFSTVTNKYSYILGLMFLTGRTPAVTLLVLVILLYIVLKKTIHQHLAPLVVISSRESLESKEETPSNSTGNPYTADGFGCCCLTWSEVRSLTSLTMVWLRYWYLPVLMVGIANCLITVAVNMSYVYAESLHYSSDAVLPGITFAVSVFKIVWNSQISLHYLPVCLHWLKRSILKQLEMLGYSESKSSLSTENTDVGGNLPSSTHKDCQRTGSPMFTSIVRNLVLNKEWFDRQIMLILLLLSIFSTVLAPYISSFLVNPNCFYYTVSTMPTVTATYSYSKCTKYQQSSSGGVMCVWFENDSKTSTYIPPFIYNYQCSSSLLDAFVSVYVYRYILSGLVIPWSILLLEGVYGLLWARRNQRRESTASPSNEFLEDLMFRLLKRLLPLSIRLLIEQDFADLRERRGVTQERSLAEFHEKDEHLQGTRSSLSAEADDNKLLQPAPENPLHSSRIPGSFTSSNSTTTATASTLFVFPQVHADCMRLFSRETYILRIAGDFAVLLTFGLVYPPLALVICVSFAVHTGMTQYLLTSVLNNSRDTIAKCSNATNRSWSQSKTTNNDHAHVIVESKREMVLLVFPDHCARECAHVIEYAKLVSPYIGVLMLLFFSFSLFDTMADSDGDMSGVAVLLVAATLPVAEHFLQFLTVGRFGRSLNVVIE